MSKDIAKDMSGALTRVDEKVGVFNKQVEIINKSQENFSRILAGVKQYGVLAEFSLATLLKDLLPASQFVENVKKEDYYNIIENNYKKVQEHYNWEFIINKYEKLLKAI